MAGMRCEKRDRNQTKNVTMRKKDRSTRGDIQRISLETCMSLPHCGQLIRWKISSPTPSVSPAKIPNHVAINSKVPMGAADAEDLVWSWDSSAKWRSVIRCTSPHYRINLAWSDFWTSVENRYYGLPWSIGWCVCRQAR